MVNCVEYHFNSKKDNAVPLVSQIVQTSCQIVLFCFVKLLSVVKRIKRLNKMIDGLVEVNYSHRRYAKMPFKLINVG